MEAWKEEMLYHHGIKGMKWGVRRYRNEDGSLTNVGKRRYAKDKELTPEDRAMIARTRAETAFAGKNAKTVADEGGKAFSNASSIYSKIKKTKRINAVDVESLSNDELRKRVERLNLERNYKEAVGNDSSKGERAVSTFLDVSGSALVTAGSALAIAVAIKQLRG